MEIRYLVEEQVKDGNCFTTKENFFDDFYEAHLFADKLFDEKNLRRIPHVIPVVKCECGEDVFCSCFTNTCDCGKDYNNNGDLLAPRGQWGEETGECWQDCY